MTRFWVMMAVVIALSLAVIVSESRAEGLPEVATMPACFVVGMTAWEWAAWTLVACLPFLWCLARGLWR